jgi:hypothetical protein
MLTLKGNGSGHTRLPSEAGPKGELASCVFAKSRWLRPPNMLRFTPHPFRVSFALRVASLSEACDKWNGPVGTSRGELSEPSRHLL